MTKNPKPTVYADDATDGVRLLLRLRLPWLMAGLAMSVVLALVISRFEEVLMSEARLAFFIPVIVYVSDAVGTQTATIYIRNLAKEQARFHVYLLKELVLGVCIGLVFGLVLGTISWFWLDSADIAMTIAIAMLISATIATVLSLIMVVLMNKAGHDPASSANPIITVVQDITSLMIYFIVASFIVLG